MMNQTNCKMKRFLYAVMLLICLNMMVSCGGGGSDVSSLYGTYEGRDAHGNTVSITLKPDSDNEWRKFGEDHSSNLGHVDSKGRFKSSDWQSIKWTWDFTKGIVEVYYLNPDPRTIIDFKNKKIYNSLHCYGDWLDGKNGIPYTFHK